MKSFRLLALTAAVLLSFAVAAVAAPVCSKKVNSFDFVVDYSGSMMMKNDKMKQDKIEVAKIALKRVNAAIPALDFKGGLLLTAPSSNRAPGTAPPWIAVSTPCAAALPPSAA